MHFDFATSFASLNHLGVMHFQQDRCHEALEKKSIKIPYEPRKLQQCSVSVWHVTNVVSMGKKRDQTQANG